MSVTIYDCGAVANTISAILDNETGIMRIIGSGAIGDYSSGYSPWYSDREDINGVAIADGITRIGTGTFYNCTNISYVDIPKSVTTIGTDTFNGCTSLKSIKLSNKVTTIGDNVFKDSGLETVKFYGSAPSYGTDVFDGVTCDIYVPQNDTSWDNTVKSGMGTNDTTWYTFDAKPVLVEYDELNYFWNKIKNYVDNHSGGAQLFDSSGSSIPTASGLITITCESDQTATYKYDNGTSLTYSQPFTVDTSKTELIVNVSKTGDYIDFTHTFDNLSTNCNYQLYDVFNMPYLTSAPSSSSSGSSSTTVQSGSFETDDIVIRCSSSFGEGSPWYLVRYGYNSSFFNTSRSDGGYPKWFEIYTSTAINVKAFSLLPRQDGYGASEYPKEFKLQGSNDGVSYTDIASYIQSTSVSTSGVFYTYKCPDNTQLYKYHRLLVSSRMSGTDNVVSLSKFYLTEAYTSSITYVVLPIIQVGDNIAAGITQVPTGSDSQPVFVNGNGRLEACTSVLADTSNELITSALTGLTWQPILGITSGTANNSSSGVYHPVDENIAFCDDEDAVTAYSRLKIGNSTAKTSSASDARCGMLCLYGTSTGCANLIGPETSSDININLPTSTGTLALASSCDPAIKTDLQDVNCLDILKTLTVKRFKYSQKKIDEKQWKKDNPNAPLSEMPEFKDNEHEPWYIHTMAQEFNEAFDVDDGNPDEIKPINEIGVCIRAIQELAKQVDELKQCIDNKLT